MPSFASPHPRYQRSFLTSVQEFCDAGEDQRWTGLIVIGEETHTAQELADPKAFAAFTQRLRDLRLPEAPRPEGFVALTTLWWVDGDDFLGRLSIRHELTHWLREFGGHIGYVVRPSARRQGHASAMLAAALPIARDLGIDPALLTCDDTNASSRRVIESNGGVLEDQREDKLRFWVPTSSVIH
ncbi:MAG: GNAT family N-acetyltransferase [Dermatophilaceae bacterium]